MCRVSDMKRVCLVCHGDYLGADFVLLGRRVGVSGRVVEVATAERVYSRAERISGSTQTHLLGVCLVGGDCRDPGLPTHHRSQSPQHISRVRR